ncbi:aminopeptidase [Desulfurobacterium sp.]
MGVTDFKDERISLALRKMAEENLCLKKGERLLIIADAEKASIGYRAFDVLKSYVRSAVYFTYVPTGRHGIEPPEKVWVATFGVGAVERLKREGLFERILCKSLGDKEEKRIAEILDDASVPDVVVAINRYSVSHTLFRKLCNRLGARFASMPLFEEFMFYTSMQADWKKVEKRSVAVADILSSGVRVRVTSAFGTDIVMEIAGRKGIPDTGRICSPGDFGNLPAGEAFIAPVEGTAEGVFVTRWAPDRKLEKEVKFFVEGGRVAAVEGEEEFLNYLNAIFNAGEENRNIAELGIGTNEKAERYDNVLEGEKILGTCHIAIGDNSAFGGKVRANVHMDFVVETPTLIVEMASGEKKTVIDCGRLAV